MNLTQHLAQHIREIHFGVNWTWVNMKETLADVTWQEALDTSQPCNSIAVLVFHTNYYLRAVHNRVLKTDLVFKHDDSFETPKLESEADWQAFLQQSWDDAEAFAQTVEQMPESQLWEEIPPKYGSFYKNIHGVVEHNHYHLGQIVVLKKLLRS